MTAAITDFTQFAHLRLAAERNDPAALREVAGQFEALFVQSLLKNMREASLGEPVFGASDQHDMYQEMLDQQLAVEMSRGKGVGLAEMLVRQLSGEAGRPQSGRDLQAMTAPVRRQHGRIDAGPGARVTKPRAQWSDPETFARAVWPHAERAAQKLNVAPVAILAQAALETGWGAHVPEDHDGRSSFNVFGIKAGLAWSGASVTKPTLEFDGGITRREVAKFRAYDDIAESFDDYAEMLTQNPRYADVPDHGEDLDGFARSLAQSGYATDPAYADKIRRVANSDTMRSILGVLKNLVNVPTQSAGGRSSAGLN